MLRCGSVNLTRPIKQVVFFFKRKKRLQHSLCRQTPLLSSPHPFIPAYRFSVVKLSSNQRDSRRGWEEWHSAKVTKVSCCITGTSCCIMGTPSAWGQRNSSLQKLTTIHKLFSKTFGWVVVRPNQILCLLPKGNTFRHIPSDPENKATSSVETWMKRKKIRPHHHHDLCSFSMSTLTFTWFINQKKKTYLGSG